MLQLQIVSVYKLRWHRDQSLGYWLLTFVFVSSVCSNRFRHARFRVLALIENVSFKTGTDTYKFLNTVHFPKTCFECFEKQRLQCLSVFRPLVMKPIRRNLRSVHPIKSPDWEEVANVFVSAVGYDHSVDPYWLVHVVANVVEWLFLLWFKNNRLPKGLDCSRLGVVWVIRELQKDIIVS